MQSGYGNSAIELVDADGSAWGMPRIRGAIAGTRVVAAAGRHLWEPGRQRARRRGRLRIDAAGRLSWAADGGAAGSGALVPAAAGELLDDGGRWVDLVTYPAYLPVGTKSEPVDLEEVFNAMPAADDVAALDNAAGSTVTEAAYLYNASNVGLSNLRVWVDPAAAGVSIAGPAGVSYVRPLSEDAADVLVYETLRPKVIDAAGMIYIRRTLAANLAATPRALVIVHAAWDGV